MIINNKTIHRAREVMTRAYAPYSNFKVGAIIITDQGKEFIGCNVENCVYGLTQCAERNAINSMVAKLGKQHIVDVIIISSSNHPCPPCGACRQAIAEFGTANTQIHLYSNSGQEKHISLGKLLPENFNQTNMEQPS